MNNDAIKSYYMDFIHHEIATFDVSTRHSVESFSDKILDYIVSYPNPSTLKAIDYQMIKSIVESDDKKNIQYTLHLLALEPHDVLNWVYYVEGDENYNFERHYFKEDELTNIIINKLYYNPITGNDVSAEEFGEIVNTVFKVSDNFIQRYETSGLAH